MRRSDDAAILLEIVRLAERQVGDKSIISAGMRIVEKMAGRPRSDEAMHSGHAAARRAQKMARIQIG